MFGQHPFERYSENDVRETIIRPLIAKLGYPPDMVTTQLTLKYDRLFLGHKKGPTKDRQLRGEADYILDVDGRLRWVIEAKAPGEITDDDREQAYSYAMHPQVRAILFAVISGTRFELFHTFEKPESGPLLAFSYEELSANFQKLQNIVAPASMRRDHPKLEIDVGKPLAPGLRSYAKIVAGKMTYTESPPFVENIVGLTVHLPSGSVIRRAEGGMVAFVRPSFHHQNLTQFTAAIDATELELTSTDEEISRDPAKPTVFTQSREIAVKQGTPVPNFSSFTTTPAAMAVDSRITTSVSGYLQGETFIGFLVAVSYIPSVDFSFRICAEVELTLR